jgi:predicted enzyme related to lactoylglutathione lyase
MPTIVHFEIPANDVERSKKFYSHLWMENRKVAWINWW